MVLLGILAAALYGSYFTVLKARERSAQGMEERRELGNTLDLLRREIDAARYIAGDKRLKFVVEDRDSFGQPASNLELTTLAPPSPLGGGFKESGVIDVQYSMVEKENQQLILTRKVQDILLDSTTMPAYPQMERISSFLVECSSDGSKWVKSWDTALNSGLPKYVRITVQVEEQEGPPGAVFRLCGPQGDRLMKGEKGFALVLTLVVTALMVAAAVELIHQVYVDTSLNRSFRDGQQASLLAESGAYGGIKLLHMAISGQSYTSLSDKWAVPFKQEDETGRIEITITEESARSTSTRWCSKTAILTGVPWGCWRAWARNCRYPKACGTPWRTGSIPTTCPARAASKAPITKP